MKWKLAFYSGGVGTFLMAFLTLMRNCRANRLRLQDVPTAEVRPFVAEAHVVQHILAAPMDPSDPTVMWVSDAVIVDER